MVIKRTAASTRMWTGLSVVTTTTRETSISDERQPQWSLGGERDKPSGLLLLVFTCQSGSANSRDTSLKLQPLLFFSSLPQTAQGGLVGTSVLVDGLAQRRQPVNANGRYRCPYHNSSPDHDHALAVT